MKKLTPEEFITLAREVPRDERVPYAFEKRVMAHLAQTPMPDILSMWTRALWRAVVPCVGIMLVAAAVSFNPGLNGAPSRIHATLDGVEYGFNFWIAQDSGSKLQVSEGQD